MSQHGLARPGEAWRGEAWPGKARAPMELVAMRLNGEAGRGWAGLGLAWQGQARAPMELVAMRLNGEAWPGMARPGLAGQGKARAPMELVAMRLNGMAGRGMAGRGLARRGTARQGPPRGVYCSLLFAFTGVRRMRTYEFTFTGITPLLMHADDVLRADELIAWRRDPDNKKSSTPGDDRSPAWTWLTYAYLDAGNVVMPSPNVMRAIGVAAGAVTLKGSKSYRELSQSGMSCTSLNLEFRNNGKIVNLDSLLEPSSPAFSQGFPFHLTEAKRLGFVLDVRRVAVNGKKHVRVRPRFDQWSVHGTLDVSEDIPEPVLREILKLAGRGGLGDWRPSTKKAPGGYGVFKVDLI